LDTAPERSPRWYLAALACITALAAALRWHSLAEPSMWVDELFTVKSSIHVSQGLVDLRILAYAPTALSYWLSGIDLAGLDPESYAGWMASGIDERTIRIPAFLTGVLSIFALGWASRRLLGWQGSLLVALLLTLSSWHLWGSQTARFYVQQFLLVNVGFLLYYNATRHESRLAMLAVPAFLIMAFLTQLTSLCLAGVFAVDWVHGVIRKERRQWGVLGWASIGGGTAACIGLYLLQVGDIAGAVSSFAGTPHTIKHVVLGLPYMTGLPVVGLALLTVWWLHREAPRLAVYLLAGMIVPLVSIAAFSVLGLDVHVRYVFVSLFPWLAAAALGAWMLFERLRPRTGLVLATAPAVILLLGMAFSDMVYYEGAAGNRPRWREAFEYVRRHRRPGDRIAGDYIPQFIASYYLEMDREEVINVYPSMEYEELLKLAGGRPTWVVIRGVSASFGERRLRLQDRADLKAYFATRTFQPYSSVHVYFADSQ
ncbi:MAG: hypothetical protein ACYS99_14180, partial [Planctomycetota bacterium]